ncbi:MAG: hypothetical protein Kow0092_22310 [Deferrisomatales bacterium]
MAESVRALPTEIQQLIDVHEWDMRTHEGVRRLQELGARSLPALAMDGELVWQSFTPGQELLTDEILRRYRAKAQPHAPEARGA